MKKVFLALAVLTLMAPGVDAKKGGKSEAEKLMDAGYKVFNVVEFEGD